MAVEIWQMNQEEGSDSTEFKEKATATQYCVRGTADLVTASDLVIATAPAIYFGLQRRTIEHEFHAPDTWIFTVNYDGDYQRPELDFEFEIGTTSLKVQQGYAETVYKEAATPTANFNAVIGIKKDDEEPEGTNIEVATYAWSETYKWPVTSVTGAYELLLAGLAGKINNAPFRGLPRKCVMFKGARGRADSTEEMPVTYRFEALPYRTNYSIGPITVSEKAGWQLEEIMYKPQADATAKATIRHPQYVRIIDVLEEADFSQLGIGVAPRP